MGLLEERAYYKPFNYPWAFEAYKTHQQMHWLPEEVTLADDLKNQITSGVVALVTSNEGKASLVVGVTKDLLENFNAVDLARVGSEAVGGKGGGGRQDMAQAGGPNGSKSKNALVAIERAMSEQT